MNPARANNPQGSTPGIWDVTFYSETTGKAPKRVFKFPSDVKLTAHPRITQEWNEFAVGQEHWNGVRFPVLSTVPLPLIWL